MDASICFKPGMCSDDGRAITGWFDVYTRRTGATGFWNEPIMFNSMEEAKAYCEAKGYTITNTQGN